MNRINKNNRETEIMDGLKRGTVVGKQMTNNKSLVWQNFSLLFNAIDSEKLRRLCDVSSVQDAVQA